MTDRQTLVILELLPWLKTLSCLIFPDPVNVSHEILIILETREIKVSCS